MKGKAWQALILPAALLVALLFSVVFFFFTMAFLLICSSSSLDCFAVGLFGGNDAALLSEELTRALQEATIVGGESEIRGMEGSTSLPASFEDLVRDISTNRQDIKAFAFKTKATLMKMEHLVQSAKQRECDFWHLSSYVVPKGMHCLPLTLAEEYAANAVARARLPPPEFFHRLTEPSFNHVVLLTDNILAASVVISSTMKSSVNPEKLVFHIVTDKKIYNAMHAWFAVNSIFSAIIEVKGLHQYDWLHDVNFQIKEMLHIQQLIQRNYYDNVKKGGFGYYRKEQMLELMKPSKISLLNHLWIHIHELFPHLNKVVFLDDDVVVQHDLSPLWKLDLNGKVVGAVVGSWCGADCCPGQKYSDYFNFTNSFISSKLDYFRCGWLHGMNIFDLRAWRKTNITATYNYLLKLNLDSSLQLWHPGPLPPALIAFEGHVHPIDPSWHVAGLGYRYPRFPTYPLEAAAVIHFSGPAKPWLENANPEVLRIWNRHINVSNEFIRKCGITG